MKRITHFRWLSEQRIPWWQNDVEMNLALLPSFNWQSEQRITYFQRQDDVDGFLISELSDGQKSRKISIGVRTGYDVNLEYSNNIYRRKKIFNFSFLQYTGMFQDPSNACYFLENF